MSYLMPQNINKETFHAEVFQAKRNDFFGVLNVFKVSR